MRFSSVVVAGGPEAPSHARAELQRHLSGQLSGRLLEDAELLLSELVTNSVTHGRVGPGDSLGLRLGASPDRVRVEVLDPGPGFDPAARRDPQAPGGFGLHLVRELADSWGVSAAETPTKVWFELRRVG